MSHSDSNNDVLGSGLNDNIASNQDAINRRNANAAGNHSSNLGYHDLMDDSKPPAHLNGTPHDSAHLTNQMHSNLTQHRNQYSPTLADDFVVNGGSAKIEAPTSQNIEAYLNSLEQRTDASQTNTRGRQRYRDAIANLPSNPDGFVPLQFVHVPNGIDGPKRAPSVPDLISYLHSRHQEGLCIPLLSNEVLRDKDREESRKEQFEERLRRAHLRLNSDAESSVTRYRSKSTPSRGGMWARGSHNGGENTKSIDGRAEGGNIFQGLGGENDSVHEQQFKTTGLEDVEVDVFTATASVEPLDDGFSAPTVIIATGIVSPRQNGSANSGVDVGSARNILDNSSVKSSDGSHRVRTLSSTLEPPPPPPPATEKERLVERERQSRLETERARRRHLALLRERQLEDSDDVLDNDGSDNVGIIGQVSFDDGSPSSPAFVGGNPSVEDLPNGNSSVGSGSVSIPRPPLPPPPATERERLVERERQARLETERARRRHLALQRGRQIDENDSVDDNDLIGDGVDEHSLDRHLNLGSNSSPEMPVDRVVAVLSYPANVVNEDECGGSMQSQPPETQNNDAEASNLPYTMELFLAENTAVAQNGADASTPENERDLDDPSSPALPYTMELFLADNAVAPTNDANVPENERDPVSLRDGDGDVGQRQEVDESSGTAPVETPPTHPILEDANLNGTPPAPVEWNEGVNEQTTSSGSVASNIASTNRVSLLEDEDAQNSLPSSQGSSWVADADLSLPHESTAHSDDPRPPCLTEADIAQLEEVEHASTGNAAPQSVRDEPSESSVAGREVFLDHEFSVATQTTAMIESVTEASDGRREIAFSDIDESAESLNVIRIDSGGSIQQYSTSASGGASSASIEVMPSSDSSSGSVDTDRLPAEGVSDSLSHSDAPGSHPSSEGIAQMHQLTENDIVALAEIDYASIGNAPPLSVRDEGLSESESSVTERGGLHFGVTTIHEIGSVDDGLIADSLSNQHENSSVEAMPSVDSVSAMPSEHEPDEIEVSEEDTVVYQGSLGSSASIEALPSVDLENEADDYNYGTINGEGELHDNSFAEVISQDIDDYGRDVESAPLLSPASHQSNSSQKPSGTGTLAELAPAFVLAIAELPTFIIITLGHEPMCSLLGVKRHQTVLASIVVIVSVLHHSGSCSRPPSIDWSLLGAELQKAMSLGILLGFLVGLMGFLVCELDLWLGIAIFVSTVLATIMSRTCKIFLHRLRENLNRGQRRSTIWAGPMMTGSLDFISCLVMLQTTHVLFAAWLTEDHDTDMC